MKKSSRKKRTTKRVLRLPDLDYAKRAVLNTLGSPESKRAYEFAIDDFVNWYCSEPRLAFSRTVVLRYRLDLEARRLAPATINLRLAAVRRLAYEAADTGLLSPELAAGIQRVKGAKRIGVRLGNWLTVEQSRNLLQGLDLQKLKGRRDKAILALMLGCGLRRGEVASLRLDHVQLREDRWVIVDLIGERLPVIVRFAQPRFYVASLLIGKNGPGGHGIQARRHRVRLPVPILDGWSPSRNLSLGGRPAETFTVQYIWRARF